MLSSVLLHENIQRFTCTCTYPTYMRRTRAHTHIYADNSHHTILTYFCFFFLQFEEYSKMIYLDADIQVFENIDHLFDLPDGFFYAVMDCFCEKTWSHSPQYSIGYCQQRPNKVTWPAEMGSPPPLYFNAGMFVFEPSRLTYENLLQALKITPPTPFAEQVSLISFLAMIIVRQ